MQARCLTYLGVVRRRQGRDAEGEPIARRVLTWLRPQECWHTSAPTEPVRLGGGAAERSPEAERLAQAALDAWRLQAMSYPFSWQALWPLIGVAVARDRMADAVVYARQLWEPDQQVLPSELEALLTAAAAPGTRSARRGAGFPQSRPRYGTEVESVLIRNCSPVIPERSLRKQG